MGRPNSMNKAGVLLAELGLGPAFLEPLLRRYLAPLCARVPALAAAGGAQLDHQKSFVVRPATLQPPATLPRSPTAEPSS